MNTPAGPSLVGLTVDNRYDITQRLAHGGMATVYRAVDTRLDREVALKILRPNMAEDPAVIEKFEAEAKNTAKINHPHVINVYDQGVGPAGDGTVAFLAMEFIEGHTLREVMRAAGPMSLEDTWNIALPVVRGVAAAHQVGLIHRDIKPENVLVSRNGDIKVADFGLARAASNHTGTGMALMGTVSYMSPELVSGEQADERSDVYALGIVLYEMLTGRRPFTGESAVSIAVQHTNSRVPAPSTIIPEITAAVDDIVLHMTEPSPEDRPANATEVLILIQHLLDNPQTQDPSTQPIHGPSATSSETAPTLNQQADEPETVIEEQPNVTILPPAVTAEASVPKDHTAYGHQSVVDAQSTYSAQQDFGNKKQHEPLRDFSPIRTSRAAVNTLLILMATAVTILCGNWLGTALMSWLFG